MRRSPADLHKIAAREAKNSVNQLIKAAQKIRLKRGINNFYLQIRTSHTDAIID